MQAGGVAFFGHGKLAVAVPVKWKREVGRCTSCTYSVGQEVGGNGFGIWHTAALMLRCFSWIKDRSKWIPSVFSVNCNDRIDLDFTGLMFYPLARKTNYWPHDITWSMVITLPFDGSINDLFMHRICLYLTTRSRGIDFTKGLTEDRISNYMSQTVGYTLEWAMQPVWS